ncbi:YaaL family protein [Clostridium hydrogenum]|uniref:YaaL family protein n=1 Tax=Clostridium hydrogenum TaxID=2855764 RepID=UPI001F1FEAE7|nr:YaaL family protein [Clostridium hydrogenum]
MNNWIPGKKGDLNLEQKNLLLAIQEARHEWKQCSEYFDVVNEPALIDYAIYKEAAAKSRYIYLLMQARKMDIRVNGYEDALGEVDSD